MYVQVEIKTLPTKMRGPLDLVRELSSGAL